MRAGASTALALAVAIGVAAACGEHGLLPTSVDRGTDFQIAEVVFDENYFYCKVEPELFIQRCGPGDPSLGDPPNGCHYNVTSFRLSDYTPLVGDSCGGGLVPSQSPTPEAQRNYQVAQARMDRDVERAPLYTRPTQKANHPRQVFDENSATAIAIRDWANNFSTR